MSIYESGTSIVISIEDETFILHKGESIFDVLLRQERIFLSFCGGKGRCGRCRIRILSGSLLPSSADRIFLTPDEIRKGIRLACTAKPKADCTIELMMEEKKDTTIISGYNLDGWAKTSDDWKGPATVIAVDIGTTTLAMQMIDTKSGRIISEYRKMNPQRSYGPDVISRIEADGRGEGDRLSRLIRDEVEKGIQIFLKIEQDRETEYKLPLKEDMVIVLSGNTVMQHLYLGYPTASLGEYPFQPFDLTQKEFLICDIKAYFLPGISAFVGADIVAGLYALRMCQQTRREKVNLFIDLGTNGELAIGNVSRLLVSATAAGPAFEGRTTASLEGTDLIKIVADLIESGIIDETGLLIDTYFKMGYEYGGIHITQDDIRALQMAKAAICAGIQVLMHEYPVTPDQIDTVYLAGGFGYYLDTEKAAGIGLIPKELTGKIKAVGNTSLGGAYLYGRNQDAKRETETIVKLAIPVNLAEQNGFERMYLEALNFPKRLS